jgi:tRNA(fMet)-specific endonuclease VapC
MQPTGSYLLDTNVAIAFLAGDPAVREHVSSAEGVLLPAVALGELYYGAHKSSRAAENVARIEVFAGTIAVIGIDAAVAKQYGALKAALRALGRPIPENDLWVAATALQHGLVLATRDRHFQGLPGLQCVRW